MRNYYIFIVILAFVVVLILSLGFYITGSPLEQRLRSYDATRISDFRNIKNNVEYYYSSNTKLPASIADITYTNKTDPETKMPYEYKILNYSTYQLCTTFSTNPDPNSQNVYYSQYEDEFKYSKGYHCITVKISPYIVENTKTIQNGVTQESSPAVPNNRDIY